MNPECVTTIIFFAFMHVLVFLLIFMALLWDYSTQSWLTALKWLLARWPVLSVMPVIWTKRALCFSLLSFPLKICRANDRGKHIKGVTRAFETGGINQFSCPVCFKRARARLDLHWCLSANWLDSGPCHYGVPDGDNVEHCSVHTICLL